MTDDTPTSRWRPIETAPRDGTRVLLWANSHTTEPHWEHAIGFWWADKWRVDDPQCGGTCAAEATHWQPLDEPPHV